MASMIWRTQERYIGVIGMHSAGKTVFLTSLIDHLLNHDPARFRLGADTAAPVTLRRVRPEPVNAGWEAFPYAANRAALATSGKWPRKTRDRAEFCVAFERSDWRFTAPLLRFFDMPGERLADAGMFGVPYEAWSDHWHRYTADDAHQRAASEGFLAALAAPDLTEATVIDAYRLALATAVGRHYKPFVSPSSFLLDAQGGVARGETPEEIAEGRYVGVSANSQLVPLPASVRATHPEMAAKFAARYAHYQRVMVAPFLESLARCHSLIVMVDVVEMLRSGVAMANDGRQMVRDLMRVIEPGETILGTAYRTLSEAVLQFRPHWVTKIAFVAPKIDLVHPLDRDRVLHLARKHVGSLAQDHDGLACRFFGTSAVVSTKAMPGGEDKRLMRGLPYRDADGQKLPRGEEQQFPVSAVPEDWPATWRPGEFSFPEVYPVLPAYQGYPPDQVGLDRVLEFVMD
jgi:predicted YcjX-like family ATPase